ncbi:NAD-dependent epimerase/dehydratase family protein [Thalassospira profundimaris]|uniref:NAD-dependent epimerase/dehydratase domain-containing protein n=1 Tax=Thalassospira profundimaris TaxID=502049 RepID=A0A367WY59_9PROT|nr:NAD-dependent epimerase/dehydratase family protein [Thalassospira profundimaris]RCK45441.1 hypothetical protein TH30_12720 [Thalassospira profundimaris]
MRIIVTGGAGFIGSAVCRLLAGRDDCAILNIDRQPVYVRGMKARDWLHADYQSSRESILRKHNVLERSGLGTEHHND